MTDFAQYGEALITSVLPSREDPSVNGAGFGVLIDDEDQPAVYIPGAFARYLHKGDVHWFRIEPNFGDKVDKVPWRATALISDLQEEG